MEIVNVPGCDQVRGARDGSQAGPPAHPGGANRSGAFARGGR
jgi:hypothetical protein